MKRLLIILLFASLSGCARPADDHAHGDDAHVHDDGHAHGEDAHAAEREPWAVTAWGEHFEIFAEADPLVAGRSSLSHTHVTILDGFQPMREGTVSVVLRDADGGETPFFRDTALRDGIFDVEIEPARPGDFELIFRIEAGGLREDIPAGTVRVGDHVGGGLLAEAPAAPGGDPVGFLKEQQWKTSFATAWAESSSVRATVRGPGRVLPRAGGELVLAAPQDGIVTGDPWPYPGKRFGRGEPVFTLVPLVSSDRSLAELEATVAAVRSELEPARARLARLEDLLKLEAASRGEVDAARGTAAALEARLQSAERDLATARAARRGGSEGGERVPLVAPFAGTVSQVLVTRGEAVSAGQALGRFIETDPVWIEIAVRSGDVPRALAESAPLYILPSGDAAGIGLAPDRVRFVSRSPEVDPNTGTVALLFEVTGPDPGILPGARVTVEVGLNDAQSGIVIPESAVIDDAGVPVVYTQASGEEFVRLEVAVRAREGDRLLVDGIPPGVRVVTDGATAIRRATLMSSGETHGHVH